jgi:hypothetical protein
MGTRTLIQVNNHYRHYKGTLYLVLALAKHSETHEAMVVYQDTTDPNKIWTRPLAMFEDDVEWQGATTKRFTHQTL